MKTYVTIDDSGNRYNDIDDAVTAAEKMELTEVEICVYDENGNLIDSEECVRDSADDHFVYCTWGVFGYKYFPKTDRVESSEILAELLNSKEEAMEKAKELEDKFTRFDVVTVESYNQTLSVTIGKVYESITVYENYCDDEEEE